MAEKSNSSNSQDTYPFFSLSNSSQIGLGFGSGLFDPPAKPIHPPPPCIEVLPSEVSPPASSNAEPIVIEDGLTLLKGRVSTFDVFGVANSDLVPGKYEGGLKLWEGSLDLVKILCSEVRGGRLSLKGKRALELGCGHGLPGIFACMEGAAAVHFQDFNAEVLRWLTIPNVKANLIFDKNASPEVRFFAGDWSEVHLLLLHEGHLGDKGGTGLNAIGGEYDIVLMAETVYDLSSLSSLYGLIIKCLAKPHGVVYMAGKKHYFGVGGGTRHFRHLIEEDGILEACLLAEVADGSSNVREVWRFSYK